MSKKQKNKTINRAYWRRLYVKYSTGRLAKHIWLDKLDKQMEALEQVRYASVEREDNLVEILSVYTKDTKRRETIKFLLKTRSSHY